MKTTLAWVMAIGAAVGILLGCLIGSPKLTVASDWSACGIPPPAPINCVHCERVCVCVEKSCAWVWVNRR